MSGIDRLLLDTNVLIALDNNHPKVVNRLEGTTAYISFVTEIELLSFKLITPLHRQKLKQMIGYFTVIDLNPQIKECAIELRLQNNVKLPDALIAATSIVYRLPLFTADKGFEKIPDLECVIFEI
jgi:predicted nucleic acid-binding protein